MTDDPKKPDTEEAPDAPEDEQPEPATDPVIEAPAPAPEDDASRPQEDPNA
jgi:hypothetical protein